MRLLVLILVALLAIYSLSITQFCRANPELESHGLAGHLQKLVAADPRCLSLCEMTKFGGYMAGCRCSLTLFTSKRTVKGLNLTSTVLPAGILNNQLNYEVNEDTISKEIPVARALMQDEQGRSNRRHQHPQGHQQTSNKESNAGPMLAKDYGRPNKTQRALSYYPYSHYSYDLLRRLKSRLKNERVQKVLKASSKSGCKV